MPPEHVFTMRTEYQQFKFCNFKAKLKHARAKIKKDKERMHKDYKAYGHGKALLKGLSASNIIPWHHFIACKLLKEDLSNGKTK
eukprot:6243373-Ditylum_brightwellii.AAC.1